MTLLREKKKKELALEGASSSFSPTLARSTQPRDMGQQPGLWREKEQSDLNTWGRQRQAEESRVVTMAVTGEGSLPLTPWVQVRLGVPSCPGHPVMETAI